MALVDRITEYLSNGGFFNPEMMEHDKVRDLLMECRDAIAEQAEAIALAVAEAYLDARQVINVVLARHLENNPNHLITDFCEDFGCSTLAELMDDIYARTPADAKAAMERRDALQNYQISMLLAQLKDLAVDMEKHSNDHIHDKDHVEAAAVEGVCADRVKAILSHFSFKPSTALADRDATIERLKAELAGLRSMVERENCEDTRIDAREARSHDLL